jgi:hypothetical protein
MGPYTEPYDEFVYCDMCCAWVDYKVYGVLGCVDCEVDLEEEYGGG